MALFRCGGKIWKENIDIVMYSPLVYVQGGGAIFTAYIAKRQGNSDVVYMGAGSGVTYTYTASPIVDMQATGGGSIKITFKKRCKVRGGSIVGVQDAEYNAGTFFTFNMVSGPTLSNGVQTLQNVWLHIEEV